jgi:hypothetical protein
MHGHVLYMCTGQHTMVTSCVCMHWPTYGHVWYMCTGQHMMVTSWICALVNIWWSHLVYVQWPTNGPVLCALDNLRSHLVCVHWPKHGPVFMCEQVNILSCLVCVCALFNIWSCPVCTSQHAVLSCVCTSKHMFLFLGVHKSTYSPVLNVH